MGYAVFFVSISKILAVILLLYTANILLSRLFLKNSVVKRIFFDII